MRLVLSLLLVLLLPALAAAQITPLSQVRTVYCLAEAVQDGGGGGGSDEYFEAASDFDFFDASYSAEVLETFAVAAAEVSQESSILETSLVMQGDVAATSQIIGLDWSAFATSSTEFEVEFEVGQDVQFDLTGSTVTQGTGVLDIQLRDGDGTLVLEIYQTETDFTIIEESGSLTAGTYVMSITAFADAEAAQVGIPAIGISVFDLELAVTTEPIGVGDLILADRYLVAGPNPLQGSTQIAYASDRFAPVTLDVLDVRGRRIRELAVSAANAGRVTWDGRDHRGRPVPQGIYFLRMRAGDDQLLRKVSVVR